VLGFDIEDHVVPRSGRQSLVEPRNGRWQIGKHGIYGIVCHGKDAVAGNDDVELHGISPAADGVFEGCDGVLRVRGTGTTMPHHANAIFPGR
jgi:hypothetical protein